MAYNTIYNSTWRSKGRSGTITISKKGYAGSPTFTLRCKAETLDVSYIFSGWEEPIVGLNATFTFQNDSSAMSSILLQLMNGVEREYKVKITVTSPSSYTLFEGFLNCETFQQPYVGYSSLTLTASNYLAKLQYKYPDIIETLQNVSFIELIDGILTQSGASYDIRVNSSIEETTYLLTGSTDTALNAYGVYTELFWKNNVDRNNGLEILRVVLSTFEMYIYWYDEYWYIERYEDIWSTSKNFVEYESGASNIAGSGVLVNETPAASDLHDLIWLELSQSLSVNPGKNNIKINLQESMYYNLTINDFTDAEEIPVLYFASLFEDPPWRGWTYYEHTAVTFSNFGIAYKNIAQGVLRIGDISGTDYNLGVGALFTRVKATIGDSTSMTITWKFATEATGIPGGVADPEDTDVVFRYWLRLGADNSGNYYFITQDGSGGWQMETHNSTSNWSEVRNEIQVTLDQFDQELWAYECQVTIPLYEVTNLPAGNMDLVVVIGAEAFTYGSQTDNSFSCVVGDVKITISETPPDNMIEGQVLNDYLEELEIDMLIFDLNTYNYKNGVLCATGLDELSAAWTDGVHTASLARMKLITKWRQYYKSSQIVTGDIYNYSRLRPFQMFTDSEQSHVFVLGSFTDMADRDRIQVELVEYDNTEVITLI